MSSASRFALLFAFGVGYVGLTMNSIAKTPDGKTPAEETVCDEVSKSLFGLCNAYCEAMDCDSDSPHASDKACEKALTNYEKKSGGDAPPCDGDGGDDTGGGEDTGDTGECELDTPPYDGTCYTDSCTGQFCCPDFNDPNTYTCF